MTEGYEKSFHLTQYVILYKIIFSPIKIWGILVDVVKRLRN